MLKVADLCAAYNLDSWFFELCDLTYKLFVTALLVFLPIDAQLSVGMAASVLFVCFTLLKRPYARRYCRCCWAVQVTVLANRLDERMHLTAATEIVLLFLAGLVLRSVGNPGKDSAIDIAMSSVCIVITLAVFFVFVVSRCFHLPVILGVQFNAYVFVRYWFWARIARFLHIKLKHKRQNSNNPEREEADRAADDTSSGTPRRPQVTKTDLSAAAAANTQGARGEGK